MTRYRWHIWLCGASLLLMTAAAAQTRREDIYSDAVLYTRRTALEKDLRERIIARHFAQPLDSNSEDGYLSACWAIEQYLIDAPIVDSGFHRLVKGYGNLSYDTRRAFLEAVYAVAPKRYTNDIQVLLEKESNAHLFALCAAYLYRDNTSIENANTLKIRMVEKFPGYDSLPLLKALQAWLSTADNAKLPSLSELFQFKGRKVIYSLQRSDRDYPGLAIVQKEDGSFVRDGQGRLQVFEQLARSGPGLPFFLTNGNTPQGIFSIQGTDISRTSMIGPTPNLQLLMPGESTWVSFFHIDTTAIGSDSASRLAGTDSLVRYLDLLPPGWRSYAPMLQAWTAGHIGRTEIIAHGTTIDPEYYKGWPFYPLTPTMGCLCAKELWNPTSGHPLVSEQVSLVNAFLSTPGRTGYLVVIDLDDQHKPVTRAEVEALVGRK